MLLSQCWSRLSLAILCCFNIHWFRWQQQRRNGTLVITQHDDHWLWRSCVVIQYDGAWFFFAMHHHRLCWIECSFKIKVQFSLEWGGKIRPWRGFGCALIRPLNRKDRPRWFTRRRTLFADKLKISQLGLHWAGIKTYAEDMFPKM